VTVKREWSGGKADGRRKQADDRKYKEGWTRIFGSNKKKEDKTK